MKEFKKELADLLKKYDAAIVTKSNKNEDDNSVEIGFIFGFDHNEWTGRHHLTEYDLDT